MELFQAQQLRHFHCTLHATHCGADSATVPGKTYFMTVSHQHFASCVTFGRCPQQPVPFEETRSKPHFSQEHARLQCGVPPIVPYLTEFFTGCTLKNCVLSTKIHRVAPPAAELPTSSRVPPNKVQQQEASAVCTHVGVCELIAVCVRRWNCHQS